VPTISLSVWYRIKDYSVASWAFAPADPQRGPSQQHSVLGDLEGVGTLNAGTRQSHASQAIPYLVFGGLGALDPDPKHAVP
jgi:hypothetical protein